MKRPLGILVLTLIFFAFVISGCCGGGSKETKVVTESTHTTTTGQELQDLKKAFDEGAISEEEYETAKKKILQEE
jgi:hypothetical protein